MTYPNPWTQPSPIPGMPEYTPQEVPALHGGGISGNAPNDPNAPNTPAPGGYNPNLPQPYNPAPAPSAEPALPQLQPPVQTDWDRGSAQNNVRPVFGGGAKGAIGSIAFLGDAILRGAMKGRQEHQMKQYQKTQDLITGMQVQYKNASQHYLDLLHSGADPNSKEVQDSKLAADAAWQTMMQMYGNYLNPQQKKKGSKSKSSSGSSGGGGGNNVPSDASGDQSNILGLLQSNDPADKLRGWLLLSQKAGPPYRYQAQQILAQRNQPADPQQTLNALIAQRDAASARGDTNTAGQLEQRINALRKDFSAYKEPTEPKVKPWKPEYSPQDHHIIGMTDPNTELPVLDPAKMPPEVAANFKALQAEEAKHAAEKKAEEDAKEAAKEKGAEESAERIATRQAQALVNALQLNDYKAAKKIVNDSQKDYDAAKDRLRRMNENLLDIQKSVAAGHPNQQAMLSLVANHIGMTLGAQKGARITRAVWDEAVQSTSLLARADAKFGADGYLTGVTINPEIAAQMVDLGVQSVNVLNTHVQNVKKEYADDLALKGTAEEAVEGRSKREQRKQNKQGGQGGVGNTGTTKTATMDDIRAFAKQKNISEDEAKKEFEDAHYVVK